MERMGPGRVRQTDRGEGTAGRTVSPARAAAVAAAAAALVAGLAACSVTVNPKNAAASHPLSSATPSATSASSAATPSPDPTSAPTTPSSTPSVGKDVDHTVCTAVRQAIVTVQQKVDADKASPRRMGQDYKNAASTLRTQATKTKNTELKTALETLGNAYSNLGADTTAHDSTDTDKKKVTEASKPLDTLCGAKS